MSRWEQHVTETTEDAKQFWASSSLKTLFDMMDTPRWAWEAWLKVAAGVITSPGEVFEPGCGIGLLAELVPADCTYYGCDINAGYIEQANSLHGGPGRRFEYRDLYDVIDSGATFDWVIVLSLFGMFPEDATYELLRGLWNCARKGMAITTINKRLFPMLRRLRFEFTAHDPDELSAAAKGLPGVGEVELHKGQEYRVFRGHHWQRGLALYVWRHRDADGALGSAASPEGGTAEPERPTS